MRRIVFSMLGVTALFFVNDPTIAAAYVVPTDYPTILAALVHCAPADTVLVEPGTYTGTGNRNVAVGGINVVIRSRSGPSVTIIDCEGGTNAFDLQAGPVAGTLIDGFTIRNGRASQNGAAVHAENASATIRNCIIEHNHYDSGQTQEGGAIYATASDLILENCVFRDNSSISKGGAIAAHLGSLTVTGCDFDQNTSGEGGAISMSGGRLSVSSTNIHNGFAVSGGGIRMDDLGPESIVQDCVLSENFGTIGCGVFCRSSRTVFSRCTFERNGSDLSSRGSGMCISLGGPDASPTILHCVFRSNSGTEPALTIAEAAPQISDTAFLSNGEGDATVYVGGLAPATFTRCEFRDNTCVALFLGSDATVRECTFVENHGGAINCHREASVIEDCVFDQNSDVRAVSTDHSGATFDGCVFSRNPAGALETERDVYESPFVLVKNCLFVRNAAESGAGVFCEYIRIESSMFDSNVAESMGGAVSCGHAAISGTYFLGNRAGSGGALLANGGLVTGCVFYENEAEADGSAIAYGGNGYLYGCTVYGNVCRRAGGGAIWFHAGSPALQKCVIAGNLGGVSMTCTGVSEPAVWCCDVFGNEQGDWVPCIAHMLGVDENIAAAPGICAPEDGDFHVSADSPCAAVNSGGCLTIGALDTGCGEAMCGITPGEIDFGSCVVGTETDSTVVIRNAGSGEVEVSLAGDYGGFGFVGGGGTFTLGPSESRAATVRFRPIDSVAYSVTVPIGLTCGRLELRGSGRPQTPVRRTSWGRIKADFR